MNGLDLAPLVRDVAPGTAVLLAIGYSNVAQNAADHGVAGPHLDLSSLSLNLR
jgi:hypothetical protein